MGNDSLDAIAGIAEFALRCDAVDRFRKKSKMKRKEGLTSGVVDRGAGGRFPRRGVPGFDGDPVVIAGVGGSGTRAVAHLVEMAGFYLGVSRRTTRDNLWFSPLFFRSPELFPTLGTPQRDEIIRRLGIFESVMWSQFASRAGMARSRLRWLWYASRRCGFANLALVRESRVLHELLGAAAWRRGRRTDYRGWGWKEPISHVYLPVLTAHYDRMKYVHVMRNGLDMAYSPNRGQQRIWGHLFDVTPSPPEHQERSLLRYWVRANRRAIEIAEAALGDRYMILSFDALCDDPVKEGGRLLEFLEVDAGELDREQLRTVVRPPRSLGRHADHDLSAFDAADLAAVRALNRLAGSPSL